MLAMSPKARYLLHLNRDSPKIHEGIKQYKSLVSRMNNDPKSRHIDAKNFKMKTESKMGSIFFDQSINTQFMKALK